MPKLVASGVSAKEFNELKSGAVNPLVVDGGATSDGAQPSASEPSIWQTSLKWADGQRFLIGVVLAIVVAFAYPKGGLALAPEITASWIAVVFIFLMSGLSLKTKELKKASKRIDFNFAVQAFNLCLLTLGVAALTEALRQTGINVAILDGMVLCAALPMTVNMVIVLTAAAGGDEAAAVFNSALGNLLGVFVTPAWVLLLLNKSTNVDFAATVLSLVYRVLIPVMCGQLIQAYLPALKKKIDERKEVLKKTQELCLIFIVYTVFCRTFNEGSQASVADTCLVFVLQCVILVGATAAAWAYLGFLFPEERELRVMGVYGCVHKTVAMGIPLLEAMFSGNSNLGMYTLPLLIWHPAQLVMGSYLAPRLKAWVASNPANQSAAANLSP